MELALCHHYRIRHSEFLSWDRDDRDKAIWFHLREQARCSSCGTRHAEWDEEQGGDRRAYVAELKRCPGCEQIEQRQASLSQDRKIGKGVHIVLKRNAQG